MKTTKPLILLGALLASFGTCEPQAFAQQSVSPLAAREAATDWMRAELKLDNSAYASTRASIDRAVRSGTSATTLEMRYRLKDKEKYDPHKIFRWAYAAYRKYKAKPDANALHGVSQAMNYNLKPGAYDWVRLRFLLTSLSFMPSANDLIPVGRRLLKVKSNDEEVTFHFVSHLSNSASLDDRKEAITLSRQWAKKFPRDVYWQWAIASALSGVNDFTATPNYNYNQAAIVAFKKVLTMLPNGHPHRTRVIDNIVRLELNFDSQGRPVKWTRQMYKDALDNTSLR